MHVTLLPEAVHAADALLDAHRVPREVVVDDAVGGLQVEPLGPGFRGQQDGSRPSEVVERAEPSLRIHATVVGRNLAAVLFEYPGQVVERVGVLGEDDDLALVLLVARPVGDQVEQCSLTAGDPEVDREIRQLDEEVPHPSVAVRSRDLARRGRQTARRCGEAVRQAPPPHRVSGLGHDASKATGAHLVDAPLGLTELDRHVDRVPLHRVELHLLARRPDHHVGDQCAQTGSIDGLVFVLGIHESATKVADRSERPRSQQLDERVELGDLVLHRSGGEEEHVPGVQARE
ncbi:MAG TPA: hypothetical protein VGN51_13845 [Acidimicrobiia bacterium]